MTPKSEAYRSGYETALSFHSWEEDLTVAYRQFKSIRSYDWLMGFRLFIWVHKLGQRPERRVSCE